MTKRIVGNDTYVLTYWVENHMTGVSGAATADFQYNGDGQRVVATVGITSTVFISNYAEYDVSSGDLSFYYYGGAARVAMRDGEGELKWLLGDHLGSTSVAANEDGTVEAEQNYMPWGETRFVDGDMPTNYQYTGQFRQQEIGLYFYNSRWFDPELGRFSQPDVIIPDPSRPVDFDRYQYVRSNSIGYIDPTGHFSEDEICDYWGYCGYEEALLGLGELLFSILWETEITWGDTILFGDETGVMIAAAFILKSVEGKYSACLWDLNNDAEVKWDTAKDMGRMAAYNEKHNVWETSDRNGNWGSRRDAEKWAGYTPRSHTAEDLVLNWQYEGFFLTNYLQFDPIWYALTGASFASSFLTGPLGLGLGIGLTVLGVLNDSEIIRTPIGGPLPITYPVLVFAPHYPASPFQIGFTAP